VAKFTPIPFGKYFLLDRIAVGGMAEIYKAKTFGVGGFEKFLVIKKVLPHFAEDQEFITMLINEAKIAVMLTHTNIVQVYDLGKIEHTYFIAMELVEGRDLRGLIKKSLEQQQSLPIENTLFIITEICKGLDYAHRKEDSSGRPMNIIHRDMSPPNVLISYEGEVKLTDFGIAKSLSLMGHTRAGVLKGKFAYMSPEQARGESIDHRADIFATGIMLWEMLTGERLFLGDSDIHTLEKIKKKEVPAPSSINPAVPQELDQVVLRALSNDVSQRYQSARDLQFELTKILYAVAPDYTSGKLGALMRSIFANDIRALEKGADYRLSATDVTRTELQEVSGGGMFFSVDDQTPSSPGTGPGRQISSVGPAATQTTPISNTVSTDTGLSPSWFWRLLQRPSGVIGLIIIFAIILISSVWLSSLLTPPPDKQGDKSSGYLTIVSDDPEIAILVDGDRKVPGQRMPIIAEKSHEIVFSQGDRVLERRRIILKPGEAIEIHAPAAASTKNLALVSLDSIPPGATILVDGKEWAEPTNAVIASLPPDRSITIELLKEGYQTASRVIVPKIGETIQWSATLVPSAIAIAIRSVPADASIYVNKKKVGPAPLDDYMIQLFSDFEIEVRKPGYLPFSKTVRFELDTPREFVARLQKITPQERGQAAGDSIIQRNAYGFLTARGKPWAYIYLGDKRIGNDLGVKDFRLREGRYRLRFSNPALKKDREVNIRISQEKETQVIVDLSTDDPPDIRYAKAGPN